MFTTTIHAPAGGHVSPVNGQLYDGGQFMPDHGLFCGMSERNQLAAINHALAARQQERHEKIVRDDIGGWRYRWRSSCFDKWTNGCHCGTLEGMAKILKLQF